MFSKATKKKSKARVALCGPSGSGKTYTGLIVASRLSNGGRLAVIDTERGSASKYSDEFDFDVCELTSFSPRAYVAAIKAAESAGYSAVLIDSLSHAWMGTGGALEMVDKATARSNSKNSYAAWREVTPEHNGLVEAMLQSQCHIVATMRVKTDYVQELDERTKKMAPRKVGLAPVQRDGMEYEFDLVCDIDNTHTLSVSKSRCKALADEVRRMPGPDFGDAILAWVSDGSDARQKSPDEPAIPPSQPLSEDAEVLLHNLKNVHHAEDLDDLLTEIKATVPRLPKNEVALLQAAYRRAKSRVEGST